MMEDRTNLGNFRAARLGFVKDYRGAGVSKYFEFGVKYARS